MSLWHLNTVSPAVTYNDWGSCYDVEPELITNPWLITCPRHYRESFMGSYNLPSTIPKFFYNPAKDELECIVFANYADNYGIFYHKFTAIYRIIWDAATGALKEKFDYTAAAIGGTLSRSIALGNINCMTMGSYNKIYAQMWGWITEAPGPGNIWKISEVEAEDYFNTGPWHVNSQLWTPQAIYPFVVVNRQDGIIVGGTGSKLYCWNNVETSPTIYATLDVPGKIAYMAWESRDILWVITTQGVILKANYKIPRWEMVSTVQNPTEDSYTYMITFDINRHRVVVFRIRADATDGAAQNQLEFYYPMVNPATLTQPVPVSSLRAYNRIYLKAHLVGDAGEGLSPYTAYGTMVPPVDGVLLTPFTNVESNGRMVFQYQAPAVPCVETLQIQVTVIEPFSEFT